MKQKHIAMKKKVIVGTGSNKIKIVEEEPKSGSKRRKMKEEEKSLIREEINEILRI